MKKLSIIMTAIAVFALLNTNSYAQNADYKSVVSVGVGSSLFGGLMRVLEVAENDSYSYSQTPVLGASYDYGVTDFLSVGVSGTYQGFFLKADDGTATLLRLNGAARVLFHYVNNDKLDLYSGVRLGATGYDFDSTSADPTLDGFADDNSGFHFRTQVVAFGMRGYFTDNIGANLEFTIGSPYFLMGGLNYRF